MRETDIIVNKIGLPADVAEHIINTYPKKYRMWVANSFRDAISGKSKSEGFKCIKSGENISTEEFEHLLSNNDSDLSQWIRDRWNYYEGVYYLSIRDWLRGRNDERIGVIEGDKLKLSGATAISKEDALIRSKTWHTQVEKNKTGTIEDEHGDIVKTFDDGYYWIVLNRSFCADEARAMSHCGRGSGVLYSLRKNKKAHLTADVKDGIVLQIKGKANTKPKKKYYTYIRGLIMSDIVKGFRDNSCYTEIFCIDDLCDADIEQIIAEKACVLKGQNLTRFSDKHILQILDTGAKLLPLSKYCDDLSLSGIKQTISNRTWWAKTLKDTGSFSKIVHTFKNSGMLFYNILMDAVQRDNGLQDTILLCDTGSTERLAVFYKSEAFRSNIMHEVFINSTTALTHFRKTRKLKRYIENLTENKNVLGDEAMEKALNLLTNSGFKSAYVTENGWEEYDIVLDVISDAPAKILVLNPERRGIRIK